MKSIPKSSSLPESLKVKINPLIQKVKSSKIKIAAFIAEHNISFLTMDHFSDLLKTCFPDSDIAQNINLKRTKTTSVIKNVIGKSQKEYLVDCLKKTKLSILTDESTDISCVKQACIVVRYFNTDKGRIVSHFFELSAVFGPNDFEKAHEGATGKNLYDCLIKSFSDSNIPLKNIIRFGSDGCNTMMGTRNSVASRMIKNFPGITIWTCICHSLHLCASEACKSLLKRCEDLARSVYSYFSMSSKRCAQFVQFQEFCSTPVHKLLHPSQTRWLSLHMVISRLLEQWDPLKLYFQDKLLTERLTTVDAIFCSLDDPLIKLFFIFLDWVLPKFTNLNSFFQSSNVVITQVHDRIVSAYKDLLSAYMKTNYTNQSNIQEINPEEESQFLPKQQMYLGIAIFKELQKPLIFNNKNLLNDFYTRVQHFMKTACAQVKKKYNFSDPIMPGMRLMDPETALSTETRITHSSLFPLISLLPRLTELKDDIIQSIDDEWRLLPCYNISEHILNHLKEPDVFWYKLGNLKLESGEYPFKNVSDFALYVLSLPHSNADC